MTKVNGSKLELLLYGVVFLLLCFYAYHHWDDVDNGKTAIKNTERQLNSSQMASDAIDQQQEDRLQLLTRTLSWPLTEEYKAEQWLSVLHNTALDAGISDGFSARLVENKQSVLGRRDDIELVSTPIDFELSSMDPLQAVDTLGRLDHGLGIYSSVSFCDMRRMQALIKNSGFKLRCRVHKIAYRRVNP